LTFREFAGSRDLLRHRGIYNVVQNEMGMRSEAQAGECDAHAWDIIATANPGCMLQLQAG